MAVDLGVAQHDEDASGRWRSHPAWALVVNITAFVVPVLVAMATATVLVQLVPQPRGTWAPMLWWAGVIAVPWCAYLFTNRLARRILPLAALLKMTLVFPDQAPSRTAVARRAASTRGLERRLEQAEQLDTDDAPTIVAEHILALVTSLGSHDRHTRGHSERVRVLTDLIADQLELPEADRDRLRWAALLHDIGKLAVPKEVLNKPGKPEAAEWAVLLRHPLEGARLAEPLQEWLGEWAVAIPQHHESYDGTGYPFGLAGEQISLGGRILAVADSYETMTASRAYKRAMTARAARQELVECAGTQFDPTVVRAFLESSVGRFRWMAGPLAALADLLPLRTVPRLNGLVSVTSNAISSAVVVAGVAVTAAAGAHVALVPHRDLAEASGVTLPGSTTSASSAPTTVATRTVPSTTHGGPTPTSMVTSTPSTISPYAPSAPSDVLVQAAVGSVTVSWNPPTSQGGSSITGYIITPTMNDTTEPTITFASAATSETVGGLQAGANYSFTVTAINASGAGVTSAPSATVTLPG